ncbi:MAG: glycosyltransferase [Candidatus Latescibacteria bacterium]|jgi:cellulose synthase/poly-beta-1,6-N-acetylglucosamine synthase-like glycosyltransferase|nr:glycosyltransferase [Candidatus Latescibacterota bacterium]
MDVLTWVLVCATALYVGAAALFFVGLHRFERGTCTSRPFVTVVVAARDEEPYIQACLESLVCQTYPADRFEVLVVDDGSQDRTPETTARIAEKHGHVRALAVGDAFPELAAKKRPLSVGIREARGELILTTDADCRVPPTWVTGMVACFEPEVGVAIGYSEVKPRGSPLTFFERLQALDFLALMSASAGSANLGIPLAATGQNLAYRKALFDAVGGFGPIGHRPSGDDVLLLQLMRRTGRGRIVFAGGEETRVSTWRTESPAGFWRQRRRWASNASCQIRLNPAFAIYLSAVFLVCLIAPAALITGTAEGGPGLPLACLGGKAIADLAVLWRGARVFGRQDLLRALPVWEILHLPYTALIGILGTLTGFTWKGRRHR